MKKETQHFSLCFSFLLFTLTISNMELGTFSDSISSHLHTGTQGELCLQQGWLCV